VSPVLRFAAPFVLVAAAGVAMCQEQPFRGEVEVRRIITHVRVIQPDGSPVLGLGPDDFLVTVGGKSAEVESADWVTEAIPPIETAPDQEARHTEPALALPPPRGRLVVLLYQTDLRPSRVTGLVRIDEHAIELVQSLAPEDRIAVAVMSSHLDLHADFTNDFEGLSERLTALEVLRPESVTFDGRQPSLARNFDERKARRATTLSEALEVIGNALEPIAGAKSVVVVGWGAGRFQSGPRPVYLGPDYDRAVRALARADTSVFSLDITQADRHTLEEGLQQLADDTGGIYIRTYLFPELSVDKLARVLTGHYELSVIPPQKKLKKEFKLRVRVDLPGVEVLERGLEFREQ
jgi:VWFA-related protein